MTSYRSHQQCNPTRPSVPFQVIDGLHDTILRTRMSLAECDRRLAHLQATLKACLACGSGGGGGGGFLGGALDLTYNVLGEYFGEVARYMPVVSQVEDKEDRMLKLVVATDEVVGCLLETLRYAVAAGGRRNVCMVQGGGLYEGGLYEGGRAAR